MIDTPTRLRESARRCIARSGLAASSREITADAGANLAAITYHFGSKDQLVADALLGSLRDWLAPVVEMLGDEGEGQGDPAARTLAAIATLTRSFEARRDEAAVYLEALVHAPRLAPLQEGVTTLWSDLRHVLAGRMAAMQADELLPRWVEPDAMAGLLVAVAVGVVLQVTVDPDGPELAAMAGQFGSLLLAAGPGS